MTKVMNSIEEKGLSTIGLIRKPGITTFEGPERLSGGTKRSKHRGEYRHNDRDLG